jgi:HK97 family phage prohead protease
MTTLAEAKSRLRQIDRDSERWTEKRKNEDGCDCDCENCEADDCAQCSIEGCDDVECASAGCPNQAVRTDQTDAVLNSIRQWKRRQDMKKEVRLDRKMRKMRERRLLRKSAIVGAAESNRLAAEHRAYRASMGDQPERRDYRSPLSVYGNKVSGYAAIFNGLSQPMKFGNRSFRERILPGAFDRCLAAGADIRGLLNHNADFVLGRTTSGTMHVSTDARGLKYEIELPDTGFARDLAVSMRRGDIDQSSFGFYCVDDTWLQDESGEAIREIVSANVFDCSIVAFPAYTQTSSSVV